MSHRYISFKKYNLPNVNIGLPTPSIIDYIFKLLQPFTGMLIARKKNSEPIFLAAKIEILVISICC
jgi:hypothetical protein